MESFELADPWGQLVSVEGNEEERIPICGDQFTIGRANGECLCERAWSHVLTLSRY